MKIGILGASSQVGSSLSYFLKNAGVEVICFTRTSYGDVFFDLLNIQYDSIELTYGEELKAKLKNLDAVLDFGYPTGQLFSIKESIKKNMETILSCMPRKTVFIYMSSIMAYGMPPFDKYIYEYFFSRSSYSYLKRYAERNARRFGEKYGIKIYNFRLGQVHGVLQSVNSSFRQKLKEDKTAYVDGRPEELTNTIFINSIAEAVLRCVNGEFSPQTYTLVSSPQWTLKELYEYYLSYYGISTEVIFAPNNKKTRKSMLGSILNFVKGYRPLLETYILMNFPNPSTKIKGKYRENVVAGLIHRSEPIKYIDFNLLGKADHVIPTNSSVISIVKDEECRFDNLYHSLIAERK